MRLTFSICIVGLCALLAFSGCSLISNTDHPKVTEFKPEPIDYAWAICREYDSEIYLRDYISEFEANGYLIVENSPETDTVVGVFSICDFKVGGFVTVKELDTVKEAEQAYACAVRGGKSDVLIDTTFKLLFFDSCARIGNQIMYGPSILLRNVLLTAGLEVPNVIPVPDKSNYVDTDVRELQIDDLTAYLTANGFVVHEPYYSNRTHLSHFVTRRDGMIVCSISTYVEKLDAPDYVKLCELSEIYAETFAVGRRFVLAEDARNTYVITYIDGVLDDFIDQLPLLTY